MAVVQQAIEHGGHRHGFRSWLWSNIRIASRPNQGNNLAPHRLLGQKPHGPPRKALRRRRADQRNYLLPRIERRNLARTGRIEQREL
jgi:hypothetical protein